MKNIFLQAHPFTMLVFYITSTILILLYNHPVHLSLAIITFIFVAYSFDSGSSLRKWVIPLLIMGIIFFLLNPLFVSRGTTILFYIGEKQYTLESIIFGLSMSLMLLAIMLLFISFNISLNGNKFIYIFRKIAPRSALLVMMAVRFVPLLKNRLSEISAIYQVRGFSIRHGGIKERAKTGMRMMQTLLTWSLEEAIQTADSMQARGYRSGKVTSYKRYSMKKQDWLAVIFLFLFLFIGVFVGYFGYGKIIIYPELGTLQLYIGDWIAILCILCTVGYPLIQNGMEKLKWKYYD